MKIIFGILIFIIGTYAGSIASSIVIRKTADESIIGKNHCMSCNTELSLTERIPIISYIVQHGRCKKCNEKISNIYIIFEIANGILWIPIYIRYNESIECIFYMLITTILLMISITDISSFDIPFEYNIAIYVLTIVKMIILKQSVKSLGVFVVIPLILLVIYVVTNGKAMGGGDIKLEIASSLILGMKWSIIQFYLAAFLAVIIHFSLVIFKVKGIDKNKLAFGPYLCASLYLCICFIN